MIFEINVPDAKRGKVVVETYDVMEDDMVEIMKYGRGAPKGKYKRLLINGRCIMSNTPDEIKDFSRFVSRAKGSILINGLGLGVILKALLSKADITDITVVEISEDVIELVGPTYLSDRRVSIINADAFEFKPPKGKRYNAVWHDIWNYITSDNLPEMSRLHRKYGRIADYQESWCRDRCKQKKYHNDI